MRCFFAGMMVLCLVGLATAGDHSKIRGRLQDYQRSHRALVVYHKNKGPVTRDAIRKSGFRVLRHEREQLAYRVTWGGGTRATLEKKLETLAEYASVQLIEPDYNSP